MAIHRTPGALNDFSVNYITDSTRTFNLCMDYCTMCLSSSQALRFSHMRLIALHDNLLRIANYYWWIDRVVKCNNSNFEYLSSYGVRHRYEVHNKKTDKLSPRNLQPY